MAKRPIKEPVLDLAKIVGGLGGLGDHISNVLMRGTGQNPGSVPKGNHPDFSITDSELTLHPTAFAPGADKPKWLHRGYCITNGLYKNVIFRGLDYDKTVLEHGIYINAFGDLMIDGLFAQLIGAQAVQVCSYNTNSKKSGKNDRVAEVGAAYYDAHVHDKGTITIKNSVITECGLPFGAGRASYAISVFPGEADVMIDNASISCLKAPPHTASGGTKYSYGAIHVSGKTAHLYYDDGGSVYQSPRSVAIKDTVVEYKQPDRPLVQIKDIVGDLTFSGGSYRGGKIELIRCKGPISFDGVAGNARIEVDGVDVGSVSSGWGREAA